MSISLATRGMLWPRGAGSVVVGQQFVDIYSEITDPLEIEVAMEEVVEIAAEVELPEQIVATVEVVETVEGEIETSDISGEVEEC